MTMTLVHPPPEAIHIISVLQALSDETRLAVVLALANPASKTSTTLAKQLGIGQSTLSRHLRILREAGVTVMRPQGNLRWTRLRREELDTRYPGLLDTIIKAAQADRSSAHQAGTTHTDTL
jgi:DNA-binding transcriptional ArsR family regulator